MKRKYIYRFTLLVIVGIALFGLIGQPISGSDSSVLRQFFFDKTSGVVIDIHVLVVGNFDGGPDIFDFLFFFETI